MKTLRQICAAMILSLTLAGSAFGGHIDTPGAPAPANSGDGQHYTNKQHTYVFRSNDS